MHLKLLTKGEQEGLKIAYFPISFGFLNERGERCPSQTGIFCNKWLEKRVWDLKYNLINKWASENKTSLEWKSLYACGYLCAKKHSLGIHH